MFRLLTVANLLPQMMPAAVLAGETSGKSTQLFLQGIFKKGTLFSPATLNLIAFEETRKNVHKTIMNADEFKIKLEKNLEKEQEFLIFVDEFKNFIRVCEKDEDIILLKKILARYNEQTKRLYFGRFNFGPEIMRLFFVLNRPLDALDFLNNEEFNSVFLSYKSYLLIMNLLFKNEMYDEVKNCFEKYIEKQIEGNKYSPNLFILYCASMYKINTKEALENGLNFLNTFYQQFIPYKCCWFLAKLAINVEDYIMAFEILNKLPPSSITVNLKALILSKTERYKEAVFVLKDFLFNIEVVGHKEVFVTSDVISSLEKDFLKCDDPTLSGSFKKLQEEITAHSLLTEKTLEDFLFEVIHQKPNPKSFKTTKI